MGGVLAAGSLVFIFAFKTKIFFCQARQASTNRSTKQKLLYISNFFRP